MALFTAADVAAFRSDRILEVANTYRPDNPPSDTYLLERLQIAERDVARTLKVRLEPTKVFPHEPSDAEIAELGDMPWVDEPGYDYDASFFQGERWGFLLTNEHPVIAVDFMRFTFPGSSQPFWTIPKDWLRVDRKAGHIRVVPTPGTAFAAPLSAFALQVMGGGSTVPYTIQVQYTAGLKDARIEWPDLVDVIKKKAVLGVVEDLYLPASGSISGDGLSQSISMDTSKYADSIDEKLFGPKGSNGGLFTAIHGIVGTVAGTLA